jgi:hypothetical protein
LGGEGVWARANRIAFVCSLLSAIGIESRRVSSSGSRLIAVVVTRSPVGPSRSISLGRRPSLVFSIRHTCATILFRHGLNARQVQMWLGHHSPAFTLDTYVHLLADDLPEASFLDRLTQAGVETSDPLGSDLALTAF